jgi:hypothetical protein
MFRGLSLITKEFFFHHFWNEGFGGNNEGPGLEF